MEGLSKDPRRLSGGIPMRGRVLTTCVYVEGLIRDYDGGEVKVAPPKWALDLNRNYPYGWALRYPPARRR
jgi:hypothetical protein